MCAREAGIGENGSVIAYADDIHLIGSPATVGLALSSLTQMSTPVEALSLDCRLSSLGLALSPGKTSILLGKEASPQAFESGLGSDLLSRLDATICHDGHTDLGTPIGTEEFSPPVLNVQLTRPLESASLSQVCSWIANRQVLMRLEFSHQMSMTPF